MRSFHYSLCVALVSVVTGFAADFFPMGVLGDSPREHRSASDRYSNYLTALREPSLWEISRQESAAEVYRFLWLRTFHHPISVRLTVRKDGSAQLTAKETNGKGGYEPGKLIRNHVMALSKQQTDLFRGRFEESGLSKLPTIQPVQAGASPGAVVVNLDGAQWLVEAVKDGRYHIVDRFSPPAGDPVRALGITLTIHLAHFKLLDEDVY